MLLFSGLTLTVPKRWFFYFKIDNRKWHFSTMIQKEAEFVTILTILMVLVCGSINIFHTIPHIFCVEAEKNNIKTTNVVPFFYEKTASIFCICNECSTWNFWVIFLFLLGKRIIFLDCPALFVFCVHAFCCFLALKKNRTINVITCIGPMTFHK